jgi:hypothetical protein
MLIRYVRARSSLQPLGGSRAPFARTHSCLTPRSVVAPAPPSSRLAGLVCSRRIRKGNVGLADARIHSDRNPPELSYRRSSSVPLRIRTPATSRVNQTWFRLACMWLPITTPIAIIGSATAHAMSVSLSYAPTAA